MKKSEGPYREETPFIERRELEEMEERWKKELSGLRFIWVVMAVLFFSVLVSFYSGTRHLVIRQYEHYRQVSMQQDASPECFRRHEHIFDQQEEAALCAEMCINFINSDHKSSPEQSLLTRDGCLGCLILVTRPMPYEFANPPSSRYLR